MKSHVRSERHFIAGREKSIIMLEDSQASPALPSDNGILKLKTDCLLNNVKHSPHKECRLLGCSAV
jgi:hypothetical protein